MAKYVTTFQAVDKTDGFLKTWVGPVIFANNLEEANLVIKNKFPYLCVQGEFVSETDEHTGIEIDITQN